MRIALAAALAMAPAPLAAQASLSWAGGVLGDEVVYRIDGSPGELFGLELAVGDEPPSSELWSFGVLGVDGTALASFPLPGDARLAGMTLKAQAWTAPSAGAPRQEATKLVAFLLSLEGESHFARNDTLLPRRLHSSTELEDGRVLVAGGLDPLGPDGGPGEVYDHFELFDPQVQEFSGELGSLQHRRARHTATRLQDGRVLLAGGVGGSGGSGGPEPAVLRSAEIFDPATGVTTPVASMSAQRVFHTATLLEDGRVLVVGGSRDYEPGDPIGYPRSLDEPSSAVTELFDPATGTWRPGPSLGLPLTAHQATRLADGTVLVSGGVTFAEGAAVTTAACRRFDPATDTFATPPPSLPLPTAFHAALRTDDGRVLVAGGGDVDPAAASFGWTTATHLFQPSGSGAWAAAPNLPSITGPDGRRHCICREPIGGPPISDGPDDLPCPGPIFYFVGGGLGDYAPQPGGAGAPSAIWGSDGSFTGWTSGGTTLVERQQVSTTVIDLGRRVLFTGASSGARDLSAELWTTDF
ncbi:MAG: kelch repeat-containing protein [Planctomycetota bacterium]